VDIPKYLQETDVIDQSHAAYAELSDHVKSLGVAHQRLVAFNLRSDQGLFLGQVVFFDDQTEVFDQEAIIIVQQFAETLVKQVKLNEEYTELKELYDSNVRKTSVKPNSSRLLLMTCVHLSMAC